MTPGSSRLTRSLYVILFPLCGMLLYVIAFAVKRQLSPSESPLVEAAILMLIFLAILLLALVILVKKNVIVLDIGIACLLIFLFASLSFSLAVPAVFDRSVSLYLINIMDNQGESGMTEEEIKQKLISVYFHEDHAIKKRLGEQIQGGNIEERSGRYYITDGGSRFMSFARFLSSIYNFDSRIVQQP